MRAYIYMYKYMHDLLHPCQVWSYFWASAQTYDCLCQWVHTIVLMSCYLFRSLYILCTACRILAYRLMLFVFHTTRNKAYPILSYLILNCHQSHDRPVSRQTSRATCQPTIMRDWWYDPARLVARSCTTCLRPLAICNRGSCVLNMTIDLAAIKFARTITHDF